jgi:hypothetical protein
LIIKETLLLVVGTGDTVLIKEMVMMTTMEEMMTATQANTP